MELAKLLHAVSVVVSTCGLDCRYWAAQRLICEEGVNHSRITDGVRHRSETIRD